MHHTSLGCTNNPDLEKDVQSKIAIWFDEFDITGHKPVYYHDLLTYQKLLHELKMQRADEYERIRHERDRLDNSLSYRVVCYIKRNGLRHTLRRAAEKIIKR